MNVPDGLINHAQNWSRPNVDSVSFTGIARGCANNEVLNSIPSNYPTLVLGESCLIDKHYSPTIVGKVKEFGSLSKLRKICDYEGFDDLTLRLHGRFLGVPGDSIY